MATQIGGQDPVTAIPERAAAAADDAVRAVESEAHAAQDAIRAVGEDLRDGASSVRAQASRLADQAIDQARSAATEGKSRAAEALTGVASAAREAAGKLGENPNAAPVGKVANQAADAIERFAGTLRDRDVDQLVDDVVGFVKRNPAVAVGAAVAVGFAIARMLRGGAGGGAEDRDPYADLSGGDGAWRG
jgi:ElaB/YqjD/DUF883 family membrane-anchored ribosome-binding protein